MRAGIELICCQLIHPTFPGFLTSPSNSASAVSALVGKDRQNPATHIHCILLPSSRRLPALVEQHNRRHCLTSRVCLHGRSGRSFGPATDPLSPISCSAAAAVLAPEMALFGMDAQVSFGKRLLAYWQLSTRGGAASAALARGCATCTSTAGQLDGFPQSHPLDCESLVESTASLARSPVFYCAKGLSLSAGAGLHSLV